MQSIKAYRDKSISNESFVLEEAAFFNCTLKNCDLFYSGGDFQVQETKLDGCRVHFRGAALRTQQMLLSMGMLKAPLQLPSQTTPSAKAN